MRVEAHNRLNVIMYSYDEESFVAWACFEISILSLYCFNLRSFLKISSSSIENLIQALNFFLLNLLSH